MKVLAILLGLGAMIGSFVPHPAAPVAALAIALVLTLRVEPVALRHAWRVRTLLLVVLFSVASALAVASLAGPTRGLMVGGAVLVRFLTLVLLATLAARHLDSDALLAGAARIGLRRLGMVFGLALNTLPHLVETMRDCWMALAMRSGTNRVPFRRMGLLAEALLAHTGRLADEAAVAASLRGHAALGLRPPDSFANLRLVVVTGPQGAGKTPAVVAAAATLAAEGLEVAGFVQEASWQAGEKTGFWVRDLRSGRVALLAERAAAQEAQFGTRFRFHREGFLLARQALAVPCDLLVADELGPVELRGAGHMPALRRALKRKKNVLLLCSVRRHLIPSLLARFEAREAAIVDVLEESDPVDRIVRQVRGWMRPGP